MVAGHWAASSAASSSECRRRRCPSLGVAVFTVAVVAGQSSNSLIVDRMGLGPAGKQAITRSRVISAVLAVVAVTVAVVEPVRVR